MHTCIHAYMHTCIHAYMHKCIHAYMHTCIHAYMHTCINAYMHTCIHTYRQTDIQTYRHTDIQTYIQEEDMPVTFHGSCHGALQKLELQRVKWRFLRIRNSFSRSEVQVQKVLKGRQEQRDGGKRRSNGKANRFNLLRWITSLKCVNSEVKSVRIHLEKGSLTWVHGTLSESPWKSY